MTQNNPIDYTVEANELFDLDSRVLETYDKNGKVLPYQEAVIKEFAEYLGSFAERIREETLAEVESAIKCPDCNGYGYQISGDSDGEPQQEHCQRCYDTGIRQDKNAFTELASLRSHKTKGENDAS